MKKISWPRYATRIVREKYGVFSEGFWVKEPRRSETISEERLILTTIAHPKKAAIFSNERFMAARHKEEYT